ncbi:L-histidine N(alpha)-methyltransferase [Sulfobacillus harzensis]|uniref:4-dimethylallyltryptophan N-methyltransferase n=1 Tax=Sulfobacillus harzensis TaxID=2729629 RepID=A0A7Y0L3L4_9FIRM|nr:L-histidine N(alpha)-methyltransferase [Sulfobacillus harzensis]NMP22468.1 L-histidine N(alpha)-methyltransferase [Sulfobacillus harzensis]
MAKPDMLSGQWQAVYEGLCERPPRLNPKWFYDARGSALFDAITRQPEYYPTRAEEEILASQGDSIARWIGPDAQVAELGAGNGEKAVMLLRHLERPRSYVPTDISSASLEAAVHRIRQAYAGLTVEAVAADFFDGLPWPETLSEEGRCLVFFGSTIGNMEPAEAENWLRRLRRSLKPGEHFLIGVDLKKDPAILNRAYNDAAGITARFNLNALVHLNRVLGAGFHPERWHHQAGYNAERGRVEMYLVATEPERIRVGEHEISFRPGDRIHTENSYKYTIEEFHQMSRRAGYRIDAVWTDPRKWFSLHGISVE